MWLGKQLADSTRPREDSTAVDMGITTIGGARAAVETRGENRDLPVYGPGGYIWQPRAGDKVLVVKGGVSGAEQCVVAREQETAPEDMAQGDVYIQAGGASVWLHSSGRIDISGDLYVNGMPYRPCTCSF